MTFLTKAEAAKVAEVLRNVTTGDIPDVIDALTVLSDEAWEHRASDNVNHGALRRAGIELKFARRRGESHGSNTLVRLAQDPDTLE